MSSDAEEELLALATTKPGSEERALKELEDLFLRFNVKVRIVKSGVGGNILIYGSVPKGYLAAILSRSRLAYSNRVMVFSAATRTQIDDIVLASVNLVKTVAAKKKISTFGVKARCRGSQISAHEIEILVGQNIKERLGLAVNLSSPALVIYIEVIGEVTGIAVSRYPYFFASGIVFMERAFEEKIQDLIQWFAPFRFAVVAFSGGVDSSVVAFAARSAKMDKALAVTFDSPLLPPGELDNAVSLAKIIGIKHEVIKTELPPSVLENSSLRCYYCKKGEMGELLAIAKKRGYDLVVDGTNYSDLGGAWRPGARALSEIGVRSPLAELKITKPEVRAIARSLGLPNAEKPSMACLASRFPYGTQITLEGLKRVGMAELFLKELGFRVIRVRDFGSIARIEVGEDELGKLVEKRTAKIVYEKFRQLGYLYVDADILGYRSGSMDEGLKVQLNQ